MGEAPVVVVHDWIHVVRDDLYYGGTKARYVAEAFDGVSTVVYASPCEGGAQVALAHVARALGKRAVIVCAKRRERHQRTVQAERIGAEIVEIAEMGMLTVIQARARELAARNGWCLAPFGLATPGAVSAIAAAARATAIEPDEVWCAAGSGTLARGLAAAWPSARRHVVQVGHRLKPNDVSGGTIHIYPRPYRAAVPCVSFSGDPHYEGKAWRVCCAEHGPGTVLFWNVIEAPTPP